MLAFKPDLGPRFSLRNARGISKGRWWPRFEALDLREVARQAITITGHSARKKEHYIVNMQRYRNANRVYECWQRSGLVHIDRLTHGS